MEKLNEQIRDQKAKLFDISIQIESFQQLRMQEMNKLKQFIVQKERKQMEIKNEKLSHDEFVLKYGPKIGESLTKT